MDPALSSKHRPLSFSASTFAKVCPSPYLQAHLSKPPKLHGEYLRPNGRRSQETRGFSVNAGSLKHTCGSAVVRTGDTAVVCGVRAEVLYLKDVSNNRLTSPKHSSDQISPVPSVSKGAERDLLEQHDIDRLSLLVPNIELATGCNPAHLPDNPPSTLAQSLTYRILTLLSSSNMIRLEDLVISSYQNSKTAVEGDKEAHEESLSYVSAFWTLYIDILFISLDGNAFDTAWLAVVAALQDTRLPKACFDLDTDKVICSNLRSEAKPLRLRCYPISTTLSIFQFKNAINAHEKGQRHGKWLLADPDAFEEELSVQTVTVVVADYDHVVKIECEGLGILTLSEMKYVTRLAEQRWMEAVDVMGVAGDD